MKNSEKGRFEDAWQKAFDNAEQAPSDDAWAGIDHLLNKAETVSMKHRVVFYQRLAAASILFALLLGGLSAYYVSQITSQESTQLTQNQPSVLPDSKQLNNGNASIDNGDSTGDVIQEIIAQDSYGNNTNRSNITTNSNSITLFTKGTTQNENKSHSSDFLINDHEYRLRNTFNQNYPSLISLLPEPSVAVKGKMREVTIVRKLPPMPSTFMSSKKYSLSGENLWASLGASTGNYSPSADLSSGTASKAAYQTPGGLSNVQNAYSTSSSKGTVFSVGMNVGKRVSRRWLLQGGVSYLNQAIGYTSNYAVVDASNNVRASVADFSTHSSALVVPLSSPYEINSVNEFISMPIQAGYMLVDHKFGFQLNSGISTDFFMQNTLTDKSGQLASASSGAGDSSPFRTVSWAGLMGTELSYRVATQYRVSIAPGLRYSLNSVLKSDATSSNPLVWDIGFRFRYIFK